MNWRLYHLVRVDALKSSKQDINLSLAEVERLAEKEWKMNEWKMNGAFNLKSFCSNVLASLS